MARETSDFNSTPSGNRVHISFFGRRNAGKSSVVNAVTGQALSIVSQVKGTTTDPVKKAMELLPIGPVLIIDTPGMDDSGVVGEMRVEKAVGILNKTDVAVLVVDNTVGLTDEDNTLIKAFQTKSIPFVVALNKGDLKDDVSSSFPFPYICVSALTGDGINDLKGKIAEIAKPLESEKRILGDLIEDGDVVILVTPIDSSAPKGRMILPQMQAVRDGLDSHGICIFTQVEELSGCLKALKEPPKMVVTDSQAFYKVKEIVPASIPLTSFSILFARFKGILDTAVHGARYISNLKDGDKVLISEGCTHHRQCEDIGTVKLPGWIETKSGKKLDFEFTSGGQFPTDLSPYNLIVHCGGCMLNEREMINRMETAVKAGVPFTNYGTLIAHINGILERSLEVFK